LNVLTQIAAGEISRDIARNIGCSKSNITYWTKKLRGIEAIRLQTHDVFKEFVLTLFGEELLRCSSKRSLGVRVPVVLEDCGVKFRLVCGGGGLDWVRLGEPRNWVKLGVRVGGVRVVRTSQSLIVHPGRLKGFDADQLLVLQGRVVERVRMVLEGRFGMVLSDVGVALHKPIFRFYTEEARALQPRVGNVIVDDAAMMDDSPPGRDPHEEYVGLERARAKQLLLSPDGLLRVEGKLDGLANALAQLSGDMHTLVRALQAGASTSNGGVPGDVLKRDPVGRV
jgi:hypothetical protein